MARPRKDDPSDASYTDSGIEFTAKQSWTQNFTDGYVIGSLDGNWTVDMQFTEVVVTGPIINGLTTWAALSDGSGGQTEIPLVLVEDRRVRLSTIPVPPAIWLFGSGLIGLVGIAKSKKAA